MAAGCGLLQELEAPGLIIVNQTGIEDSKCLQHGSGFVSLWSYD